MVEPNAADDLGLGKRRSTRVVQAVPITVTGTDALGQPFKERTSTVMVNCHGCKYQSKHYVPKNSTIVIEIPRPEPSAPPRVMKGRVIWVQRPRTVRELFQIGLEFEIAGNAWGIAFPPDDWFAMPDEAEELQIPVGPPQPAAPAPSVPFFQPPPAAPHPPPEKKLEIVPPPPAAPAPARPAATPVAHTVAPPAAPPAVTADLASEMERLMASAKQTLNRAAREDAQTAISSEIEATRAKVDAQLKEAVEHAVQASMARASENALQVVIQRAAEKAAAVVEEARTATKKEAADLETQLRQSLQSAVEASAAKAAEQSIERAVQQAAQTATSQALKEAVEAAVNKALADRPAAAPEQITSDEAARAHSEQLRRDLADAAEQLRAESVGKIQAETAAATGQWQNELKSTLAGASVTLSEKLAQVSEAVLVQAEQDIAARSSSLRESLDSMAAEAQKKIDELGAGVAEQQAQAKETKNEIQDAARQALENTRQRLENMLSAQFSNLEAQADSVIAEQAQKFEPALEAKAQLVFDRVSDQVAVQLAPQLADAEKIAAELASARAQAEEVQKAFEANIRESAGSAIETARQLVEQQTAKIPEQVEAAGKAALERVEEQIEAKTTEATHTTFEALLKASDWYTKKAHSSMQVSLEKAVEQSTDVLHERAAEASRKFASELDHNSRSFVEHARQQMEEAAADLADKGRQKINEAAQIEAAGFADEVHRVAGNTLSQFEEASRESGQRIQAEISAGRRNALTEFRQDLDDHLSEGLLQAREGMEAQLKPLMELWQEQRENQQKAWMDQLKGATNESIDQYKARLENASNSWLLASATTLGQHSQAVLDTLAKAAEKRLRETCAEVLASMGDTLKQRLLNMSGDFTSGDETADKADKSGKK